MCISVHIYVYVQKPHSRQCNYRGPKVHDVIVSLLLIYNVVYITQWATIDAYRQQLYPSLPLL